MINNLKVTVDWNKSSDHWSWIAVWSFILLYLSIASTFRYAPFIPYALEFGILFSILLLATFKKYRYPKHFRYVILYIILLIVYLIVAPALTANSVYGQPIFIGFATNRAALILLEILALTFLVFSGRFSLKVIEISLIFLAWLNLILGLLALSFLDPNSFSPEKLGSFLNDGGGTLNSFNLPKGFSLIGAFYYFFHGFYLNNSKAKFFSLVMFGYIFFGGNHRALLISTVVALIFVILQFRYFELRFRLRLLAQLAGFSALVVAATFLLAPTFFVTRLSSFGDAFMVVMGADVVADWSAAARISQLSIAVPAIFDRPLFGHGNLSSNFNGGYSELYGYFHPSDLGVIGVIFVFGLFGTILLLGQYFFYFRYCISGCRLPASGRNDPMLFMAVCMLVVHILNSGTSGMFAFYPERGFFFILVIALCTRHVTTIESNYQRRSNGLGDL